MITIVLLEETSDHDVVNLSLDLTSRDTQKFRQSRFEERGMSIFKSGNNLRVYVEPQNVAIHSSNSRSQGEPDMTQSNNADFIHHCKSKRPNLRKLTRTIFVPYPTPFLHQIQDDLT